MERLRLPARVTSVRPFCEFARRVAAGAEFSSGDLETLDLVIEEIVVNIARYAYDSSDGEAELACCVAGPRKLALEISDEGRPFNPLGVEPPDLSRGLGERTAGGLGIFLVRSIAESIAYMRDSGRNVLSCTFTVDS